MVEQEHFKHLLKKVIDATENDKIKTPDELMQVLIHELTTTKMSNQHKAHIQSRTLANEYGFHH
ncbi:MAG TPA: hypothetical protein VF095_06835 [Bacillota bacterium]